MDFYLKEEEAEQNPRTAMEFWGLGLGFRAGGVHWPWRWSEVAMGNQSDQLYVATC